MSTLNFKDRVQLQKTKTVYCTHLSSRLKEKDLINFFTSCGTIVNIQLNE